MGVRWTQRIGRGGAAAVVSFALLAVMAQPVAAGPPSYTSTVSTIAGDGTNPATTTTPTDGVAATATALGNDPSQVAYDSAGNLYVAVTGALPGGNLTNVIRRVDHTTHLITTVAALNATVTGVAVDGSDRVYASLIGLGQVVRIGAGGSTTVVAGGGTVEGDGVAATSVKVPGAGPLAFDGQGNLYISQSTLQAGSPDNRIRKVATNGIITTVAGTTVAGFGGDGGPATAAHLNGPAGIAFDATGALVIADAGNNRVRKVAGGTITTIAGTGVAGSSGDGGKATAAKLTPTGLAFDQSGWLYVADTSHSVIRRISPGGTISTFAGTGTSTFNGDGLAPKATNLAPLGLASRGGLLSGALVVAEPTGYRVRSIPYLAPIIWWQKAVYQQFVQRDPSPSERAAWAAAVEGGTASKAALLDGLVHSTAWTSAIVDQLYVNTLGRTGDAGGVTYWSGQLQSGQLSVAAVAARFYASNEYFNGLGRSSVTTWLGDLYQKLLHRTPDAAGLAWWSSHTRAVGRTQVALELYQSQESRLARVGALYRDLLGRGPDAAGASYWAGRVLTEGDLALATSLAQSNEYAERAVLQGG